MSFVFAQVRGLYIPCPKTLRYLQSKSLITTAQLTESMLSFLEDTLCLKPEVRPFTELEASFWAPIVEKWKASKQRRYRHTEDLRVLSCLADSKAADKLQDLAARIKDFYVTYGVPVAVNLTESAGRRALHVRPQPEAIEPCIRTEKPEQHKAEAVFGFTKLSIVHRKDDKGHAVYDVMCSRKIGSDWAPPAFVSTCTKSEASNLSKFIKQLEALNDIQL